MITEYCAASCDDSEEFERTLDGTWWGSALEWAAEQVRPRSEIIVAVGIAGRPQRISDSLRDARSAHDLLTHLTESHDDYQVDFAESYLPYYGGGNISQKQALLALGEDLAEAIAKYERKNDMLPKWFIVQNAAEITLGLAEECARLAAHIDLTGRLQRFSVCKSFWVEIPSVVAMREGTAETIRWYDIWQAAARCDLRAPNKPGRVPGG